ncbi:IS1 family transposase [Mucilaginibacter flavus]|uniref:IS1 family transposase n=1 Tax=Mucilaginibacter flavus TaxID=931504 RepID=UPI0025B5B0ED|nr:IS1 family transposase [Mucilaginibacter flavus]MDN3583816.1 IS1 family transposase [Mucilaginibacter flavus]
MNRLPISKRVQIINLLVEGMSLRATSRIADVSINTVTKLLVDVGKGCLDFHDATVHHIKSKRVECDEIWSFVYSKNKNTAEQDKGHKAGDVWTWVGIDRETKLVLSWYVGNRDAESAYELMKDIKSRLRTRAQMTTDGFKPYLEAVSEAFGSRVDFAQLVKIYGTNAEDNTTESNDKRKRYKGAKKVRVQGKPDKKYISTSMIERQNLTMRMHMRRFTRKTNAFSKKVENHCLAIALHFVYYNFAKIHTSLRVTPAMEAGLAKDIMTLEEIVRLAK